MEGFFELEMPSREALLHKVLTCNEIGFCELFQVGNYGDLLCFYHIVKCYCLWLWCPEQLQKEELCDRKPLFYQLAQLLARDLLLQFLNLIIFQIFELIESETEDTSPFRLCVRKIEWPYLFIVKELNRKVSEYSSISKLMTCQIYLPADREVVNIVLPPLRLPFQGLKGNWKG